MNRNIKVFQFLFILTAGTAFLFCNGGGSGGGPAKPSIQFSSSSGSGEEGDAGTTDVNVEVELSCACDSDVSVVFSVSNSSTATATDDYTISSSPLVIAAGSTTASIPITINGNTDCEAHETIVLTLDSATNAAVSGTTSFAYTITNDDSSKAILNGSRLIL